MTCPHQSQPPGKDTGRRLCALGWFGGKPFLGNCMDCIKRGRNTPEARAEHLTQTSGRDSLEYRQYFDAVNGYQYGLASPEMLPSLATMAGSALSAVVQEAQTRAPGVSAEEQARRLSICEGCDYYTANSKHPATRTKKNHRCVICGCYLNLKSRLATSQCPAGKWGEM
jgi:hypothetical protein